MSIHTQELKRQAAHRAVEFITSGMIVGLGHGSTASLAVARLAERLRSGDLTDIIGIPCSVAIGEEAISAGIPLSTLNEHPVIDLTVDGADEVDPQGNLIKGGGGALLREKIVAQASKREIIMVDESKMSPVLGTTWAVPVEVVPFGWRSQADFIESIGAQVSVRTLPNGEHFLTDQGNMILDCNFGPINDPHAIDQKLNARVGVVEHGLFLGIATDVVVADSGGTRVLSGFSQRAQAG